MERASGILLPVFSLPGEYGIGTFGKEAYKFVDFLKKSKQKYWQVLPLGETGCGNSPYSSYSTFALNPYFIDLDELINEGLLTKDDCKCLDTDEKYVDYERLDKHKLDVLRTAYKNADSELLSLSKEFEKENIWLHSYALYMALKEEFNMLPWNEWQDNIRLKNKEAVEHYENLLSDKIRFYVFVQYIAFSQWNRLKKYANDNGIKIIGDLPIYVAMDSADVWAETENFAFDKNYKPLDVAGVPPDYFSEEGQLWGNPLYDWDKMKEDGYGWWIRRIDGANKLFDIIRIDHFRGLSAYWAVPSDEKTAKNGEWRKGPGIDFINRMKGWFSGINIIAEDLGILDDDVRELLKQSGFPGMKVLEFAFDSSRNSDYLPHKYDRNCVCYCGTHDNATLKEWLKEGDKEETDFAKEYFRIDDNSNFNYGIIFGGMASVADLFVAQMQDYLELGGESRTNIPGKAFGNWKWRMEKQACTDELAEKIAKITELYGR